MRNQFHPQHVIRPQHQMMKIVYLLVIGLCFSQAFDAPRFELSEEMRSINMAYHNGQIDGTVKTYAFVWANGSSGQVNTTLIAQLKTQLTAYLTARTTSTFRQCDRLNAICYQCENGAANVSSATIDVMVSAKLYGQSNNMLDIVSEQLDLNTFTIQQSDNTPVWVPSLSCRATPSCFPNSTSQLIRVELQGDRRLTFKRQFGSGGAQLLIHRINTGAYYTYFPASEAGVKILVMNNGANLVPDSILEDFSLTGIFCFSSKRSVVYYQSRGLPLVDSPADASP